MFYTFSPVAEVQSERARISKWTGHKKLSWIGSKKMLVSWRKRSSSRDAHTRVSVSSRTWLQHLKCVKIHIVSRLKRLIPSLYSAFKENIHLSFLSGRPFTSIIWNMRKKLYIHICWIYVENCILDTVYTNLYVTWALSQAQLFGTLDRVWIYGKSKVKTAPEWFMRKNGLFHFPQISSGCSNTTQPRWRRR